MWDAFGTWESDSSYNAPAVPEAAQTDVLQGTQSAPNGSNSWTGFFQDVVKSSIGYATQKDAAQTRVDLATRTNQAQYSQAAMQRQATGNNMMPLLLIAGVAVFLLSKD